MRAGLNVLCLVFVVQCFLGCAAIRTVPVDDSVMQDIGQMVMVGFRGLDVQDIGPLKRQIEQGRVGGVILFSKDAIVKGALRNIQDKEQVTRLVQGLQQVAAQSNRPALLVAVDQEGGRVARFSPENGFPETLTARDLGERDVRASRNAGVAAGTLLAEMGIHVDLAPVVDVDVNPRNPAIGKYERSFSADPVRVGLHADAFCRGLMQQGVAACAKHFPGHGSACNDSHLGVTDITDTWSRKELEPYRHLIESTRIPMIMTGHLFNSNLDPKHPATLSKAVLHDLLRTELGFEGVVVSDDMQMKAITSMYGLEQATVLAVNAGVDILLSGNNLEYDPALPDRFVKILTHAVATGSVSVERIRDAAARIRLLKQRYAQ